STHARGKLEAEDRGRGATHDQPITALVAGPADRFLSGSRDASVKSWPRAKGARPVTLKDGIGKVVALAVLPVHGRPQVAAACDGLRRHAGPNDLRPLVLALRTDKADVGQRAVQALEGLAAKDDQARARLVGALEAKAPEVRRAALASLERVFGPQSPEASL